MGWDGNFWGHNALIRVKAFADAAGLPKLSGQAPFGGDILSHDFVEAAWLRRAGWGVELDLIWSAAPKAGRRRSWSSTSATAAGRRATCSTCA